MQRRDWLLVAALLLAAVVAGWPAIRQTPAVRYLAGECEWRREQYTFNYPRDGHLVACQAPVPPAPGGGGR